MPDRGVYRYQPMPRRTPPSGSQEHVSPNHAPPVSPNAASAAFAIADVDPRLLTTASVAVRHFCDASPVSRGGILGPSRRGLAQAVASSWLNARVMMSIPATAKPWAETTVGSRSRKRGSESVEVIGIAD